MTRLLRDGPKDATVTWVFAHGAGAPMDSAFMSAIATSVGQHGIGVVRFEFDYMAKRRQDGKKRGPDRAQKLMDTYREVLESLGRPDRVVIGGKSMGGRIASMIADDAGVLGLVCLGYPFHPPGRPERVRTAHLSVLATPTLIVQGTRDRFGTPDEVASYDLSEAIDIAWMEDGDHSLKPRKKSGRTEAQNLEEAWRAIVRFIERIEDA